MSDGTETSGVAAVETRDGVLIVRPHAKELEDDELKALGELIDKSAGPGSNVSVVVLDMSQLQYLPSVGLGLVVRILNRCKGRQQKLKLAGVQPPVRQVFSITQLDRLFEFVPTVEAGLG